MGAKTLLPAWLVGTVYLVGSMVCHQLPGRSFHWFGAKLPVCARCSGLYLGAAIGVVGFRLWAIFRTGSHQPIRAGRATQLLVLASLPTLVTLSTAAVGLWDPPNLTRFLSALPLGAAAGAALAAVVSNDLR